jgi:glycosyltransferase involved in cell wall biosynthesis
MSSAQRIWRGTALYRFVARHIPLKFVANGNMGRDVFKKCIKLVKRYAPLPRFYTAGSRQQKNVPGSSLKGNDCMQPEVTFVIPVFNNDKYLDQCLEWIINQSFQATEVICVNDGSTDRSGRILDNVMRVDSRVRVINNGRNLGAAESRNRGIRAARGRFIRFVDADDLVPLQSTEILYDRAVVTGSDVVRGSLALFKKNDHSNFQSVVAVTDREKTSLRTDPSLWVPWWHTSYLICTQLIRANNLAYPALRQKEDPVFLASVLVSAQRISLVPDIVYLYRKYRKTSGSGASTFADVADNLKHAALVKSLFTVRHPDCWNHGYGPFLLGEFRAFIARCRLDTVQVEFVASETAKIWGPGVQLCFADNSWF